MPDEEVPLDENALLDFDRDNLFRWRQEDEDRHLADHRDLYFNHLLVAKHLEFWAANLDDWAPPGMNPDRKKGRIWALEEVAAHLRLGNYLPGGSFYAIHEPQPWRRWKKELLRDEPPDEA